MPSPWSKRSCTDRHEETFPQGKPEMAVFSRRDIRLPSGPRLFCFSQAEGIPYTGFTPRPRGMPCQDGGSRRPLADLCQPFDHGGFGHHHLRHVLSEAASVRLSMPALESARTGQLPEKLSPDRSLLSRQVRSRSPGRRQRRDERRDGALPVSSGKETKPLDISRGRALTDRPRGRRQLLLWCRPVPGVGRGMPRSVRLSARRRPGNLGDASPKR